MVVTPLKVHTRSREAQKRPGWTQGLVLPSSYRPPRQRSSQDSRPPSRGSPGLRLGDLVSSVLQELGILHPERNYPLSTHSRPTTQRSRITLGPGHRPRAERSPIAFVALQTAQPLSPGPPPRTRRRRGTASSGQPQASEEARAAAGGVEHRAAPDSL